MEQNNGEIIIYQSEDGKIRLDVRLENKTVWLTIDQIAELYGKSRSTVNEHILNAYDEGEIEKTKTMRKIGRNRIFGCRQLSELPNAPVRTPEKTAHTFRP